MMNMMAPKKKMSTLILDFQNGDLDKDMEKSGSKQEGKETEGEDYPVKVAGRFIDAVKSGDKKELLSSFKELMSCCSVEDLD